MTRIARLAAIGLLAGIGISAAACGGGSSGPSLGEIDSTITQMENHQNSTSSLVVEHTKCVADGNNNQYTCILYMSSGPTESGTATLSGNKLAFVGNNG